MTQQEKLDAWASILSVAYDSLSAREFDYFLDQSPFSEYKNELIGMDNPAEFCHCETWEPTASVELYFRWTRLKHSSLT